MTQKRLLVKICSEGYCCMHGYLRLCRARGEKVEGMSAFIRLSKRTIYYWYQTFKRGKVPCQRRKDCLIPIIEQFEEDIK